MISERDLMQAIRECEADPITSNKIGKLADLYVIYDHLYGEPMSSYSAASAKDDRVYTPGGSAFLDAVDGRRADIVWHILDELMDATRTLHPRMYDSVMDRLMDA